ncbi:four helix bundle protein [Ferrovibrio xuzhouensis]|uniref:Four helix bundle protein n=1 Tax=Ferrovibrio xuzhouensis TaxID=1576914 RepID=A0ABV7VDK3_9PROT
MARATDLPIYRVAYELLQLLAKLTQQYPRGYRQGLAREVFAKAQAVVIGIFSANSATDKTPHLETLREHLEALKLLLRLSKDLHLISAGQFGATAELTDAIGKQASGWLNYARNRA